MSNTQEKGLLEVMLDAWDRNNTILLNLLQVLPDGGLNAKATADSPSVSEMFTHIHHERMISVFENAPEFAGAMPEKEWVIELNSDRIVQMLKESAKRVRDAVESKVNSDQAMDLDFDHPILLLQLLIFHEGYHHGQIKLALKVKGIPVTNDQAGPLTWDIWRRRK